MSDPGPTSTQPTVDDLIAAVRDLDAKRTALADAHAATVDATQNVTDVTVIEQAKIDAATADFDKATTEAKQDQVAKQDAEHGASDAEDASFADLEAKINAFKAG